MKETFGKKQIRFISNSYGNTILCTKLVSFDTITSDFAKHTIFHNIPFYQMSIYCLQVIKLQGFLLPSGSNCLLLININRKRWLYHQIGKEYLFLLFTVSQRSSMSYLLQGSRYISVKKIFMWCILNGPLNCLIMYNYLHKTKLGNSVTYLQWKILITLWRRLIKI